MSPVVIPLLLIIYLPKVAVNFGLFTRFKKVEACAEEELPTVSILVPARNEAEHIANCLNSLLSIDYPEDKFEVLIGNDQSTDNTAEVVIKMTSEVNQMSLVHVEAEYEGLVARSNVLAQLARKAEGEFMVFLDADMQVDRGWLKHMIYPTLQGYQIVSGYTRVKGSGWLAKMQEWDWYNVLAWLKAASDLGQPGTALGNNMLVSKAEYYDAGGYEKIGPTFTEDNDLTLALRKQGARMFQVASTQHAATVPVKSFSELVKQRNRWMIGAFRQPLYKLIPVIISRLFVFVALLVSPWSYKLAVAIIGHSMFIDLVNAIMMWVKSGIRINIVYALVAPVFNSVLDTFTLLSYPFNRKVVWKGRKL